MATFILPVRAGVPDQTFEVELEGTVYGFQLRWNHRAEFWVVNVYDAAGAPLILGRRLCLGTFLMPAPRRLGWPPGDLFLVEADSGEATLETLGATDFFVYEERAS